METETNYPKQENDNNGTKLAIFAPMDNPPIQEEEVNEPLSPTQIEVPIRLKIALDELYSFMEEKELEYFRTKNKERRTKNKKSP